jgi:hypothetical protein
MVLNGMVIAEHDHHIIRLFRGIYLEGNGATALVVNAAIHYH